MKFQKNFKNFEKFVKKTYEKSLNILEKKYCWKCPQKTTSHIIKCREVEIYQRLYKSFKNALNEFLINNYSKENIKRIKSRLFQKISKEFLTLVKIDENSDYFAGSWIILRRNSRVIKKGDLILYKTNSGFKMSKVLRKYCEDNLDYIDVGDKKLLNYEIYGKIEKIIEPNDDLYPIFENISAPIVLKLTS
ncbi:hypothetical protein Mfer_0071 [Methanothermus fervidus DSM 2088]|uniref:Uncharacterized protein n=1 Tax=Methanothermus fervidus (strain ATCC 43054 / DSM 2088 / JCM 10308 / V24 S) TaxID=523846 RepID=E3GWY6_METFV|nr:hypothetical protein [Methanothermus fervidus]ADP76875.1 hypothetical protein Mfer_0071 [Methanothermus fervidus DSM 2088]